MRRPDRYEALGNGMHRAWFGDEYADVTLSRERDYPGLRWDCIHLPLYEMAAELLRIPSLVFDAGCGGGYGSLFLSARGHVVHGCDVSMEALQFAWFSREPSDGLSYFYSLDLSHGIGNQIGPFCPQFEAIVAIESIEHIEDDAYAMADFFRSTRRGGLLFLTTPEASKDRHPSPFHVREYSRDELATLVTGAGWEIVEWKSHRDFPDTMIVVARKP